MYNKAGFIFIETIIVICVLTIALMSLYSNYSKILTNTRELNTFDTTEYNYKTYFLKKLYSSSENYYVVSTTDKDANDISKNISESNIGDFQNECKNLSTLLPEQLNPEPKSKVTDATKICFLIDITDPTVLSNYANIQNVDAYIIDYLNNQDLNEKNDRLFLVEYKKQDKQNSDEYLTYISSLTF